MFKKLLSVVALGALLSSSAFAEDILAKVSNGAISDNNAGSLSSYGYIVLNDNDYSGYKHGEVSKQLGYSSNGYIVAKYRYVNNQKDYYLQYFSSKYGSGTNIWAYANSPAYEILRQFKNQY
ncbi:hypothetical protein ACHYQT_001520 [Campylobacter jejuni]|uniref:Bacteriocin-type signal sequence domain-containing protein n=1 Tax=Campylobacter jejuni TaxID=197 RepID=A0A690DTR3_CAMJU|nr:hypothetical protein [Campylobacter jejuni]EAH4534313.1 hypothetical protein [Campylobacter jejuni]EAH4896497.1 hypothetical protein [Campylobacter jejuni]EAH5014242.1 hypothetical protein [Campylobacter jejuni]EAH5832002.1 hypothetical protein [Campylobacter jejuni]EAH5883671.1 hypothetical protein [Campylobacter jejuni]